MTGKNENAEILRKTDALLLAEKKKEVSSLQTPEPTMGAGYIRFNPAVDLKPAFLEHDCTMLKVNQFWTTPTITSLQFLRKILLKLGAVSIYRIL